MKVNEIKLKPCPFCGGSAVTTDVSGRWAAICTTCGTIMTNFATSNAAARAWNRRKGHQTYRDYLDESVSWDSFPNANVDNIIDYVCIRQFFGNAAKAENCGEIACSECWNREMP